MVYYIVEYRWEVGVSLNRFCHIVIDKRSYGQVQTNLMQYEMQHVVQSIHAFGL